MTEVLIPLRSACTFLNSDKVNERKRQIEVVRKELGKRPVLQQLDISSDGKKSYHWDDVFKAVWGYMGKEIELLKGKGTSTAKTSATNNQRKREVKSTFRWIVGLANGRGPRLCCSSLVKHILSMMKDDFCSAEFGADCCAVLTKEVLGCLRYWCELNSTLWQELVETVTLALHNTPSDLSCDSQAKALQVLIAGAAMQGTLPKGHLFKFFSSITKRIRSERSTTMISCVLSALNKFCLHTAPECRQQLCQLGEKAFKNLILTWKANTASSIRDELVDFFRLQMRVHHPRGVMTEEDGAYAVDFDQWKNHVTTLYEELVKEWKQEGAKLKLKGTGKREVLFKQGLVALAADVCHQVFKNGSVSFEVTQMGSQLTATRGGFTSSQITTPTKRRRLESGWELLREQIAQPAHNASIIPWLQLIAALITKYPDDLPEDEMQPLISTLNQLQSQSKRVQLQCWVLRCLQAIAASQAGRDNLQMMKQEALSKDWAKVWAATIRTIGLHSAEDDGFDLLRALVHHEIVKADKEVWKLFLPDVTQPSRCSIQFLVTLLNCQPLPENHVCQVGLLASITAVEKGQCPLRHQLLNWLLPAEEVEEAGERLILVPKILRSVPVNLLAHTISMLTAKDCRNLPLPRTMFDDQQSPCKAECRLAFTEDIYLRATFHIPLKKECTAEERQQKTVPSTGGVMVGFVVDSVLKRLQSITRQVTDSHSKEVDFFESMGHLACLISRILASVINYGEVPASSAVRDSLSSHIKILMRRLSPGFKDYSRRADTAPDATTDRCQALLSLLSVLAELFSYQGPDQREGDQLVANLQRRVTPSELLDVLLDIVHNKGSHKVASRNNNGVDLFGDPMDLGSDDEFSNTQSRDELDDEFDAPVKSECIRSSKKKRHTLKDESVPGTHSMLSPDSLSKEEQLAIECVKVLSSWCWTGGRADRGQTQAASTSSVDRETVSQKLLEVFDDEVWDKSSPFGVQLFFAVASNVAVDASSLTDAELCTILEALRSVVACHRKVQEICVEALKFLHAVIPRLGHSPGDVMVSPDLKEAREVALLLLAAFWQLKSSYTTLVRQQMAQCMEALVKADSEGSWAVMRSKVKGRGQGDADEKSKVKLLFPYLLKDRAHEIQMYMTSAVGRLFNMTSIRPHRTDVQNHAFDVIYQTVQEAIEITEKLSDHECQEESSNRTSSLLLTLANIVCQSPVCQKKAIFALLQTTRINGIQTSVMQKVFSCIAQSVLYCDTGPELAEIHLGFLVHQWLQEEYSIRDFPYPLLGCSLYKEFLSKHHTVIIPHLVMKKQLKEIQAMGDELHQDWKALLKQSFPRTIASILPLLAHTRAADTGDEEQQERAVQAVACLAELEKAIGKETNDAWIQSHLDSIVVELLTMLCEPTQEASDTATFVSDTDPKPDPPYFTSYMIKATLDHLTKCHAGGRSLTPVSLLAKTRDSIQKVLLALHTRIAKARQPHEKRRIVLAYRLFGLLLVRELRTTLGGSWVFVLADMIHTLVHTITGSNGGVGSSSTAEGTSLVRPCIDLLYNICEMAVQHCPDEFCRHIQIILRAIVPLVSGKSEANKQALSLVEFIVVDNASKLEGALQNINPLPKVAELRTARDVQERAKKEKLEDNLLAEINHFLMRGGQHGKNHSPEGLERLGNQLAMKKTELALLVSMCAENASESVLPQLICELVSLSSSNHGNVDKPMKALQQGAARCLGEIGAPDLSIIALQTSGRDGNESYATAVSKFTEADDPISCRNAVILHLLKGYLSDPCVDTIAAAATCLKNILATATGQQFYEEYRAQNIDTLFAYLLPFRSTRKKTLNLPVLDISDEAFLKHVNDELLWQPHQRGHDAWLKGLTVALIKSGGVRDEILRLLEPVCVTKVEFAERILPYLIHDILSVDNVVYRQVLSEQVRAVFTRFTESSLFGSRASTPMPSSSEDGTNHLGHRSIKSLLDMVHYLRTQKRSAGHTRFTPWDNNFWLDLDYLVIAKAAQDCQAHFTCLLYSEIWWNAQSLQKAPSGNDSSSQSQSQESETTSFTSLSTESGINVQTLLLEALGGIGEPDSVYGCGAGRLVDTNARIHTYEHEGEWGKALAAYDIQMQTSSTENMQLGLLQAMQNFGLVSMMQTYLQGHKSSGMTEGNPALAEYQYEAAWRNGLWDMDTVDSTDDDSLSYHKNLYTALNCLKSKDKNSFEVAVDQASQGLTHFLANASMESVQRIYPLLSRIQALVELQDFSPLVFRANADPKTVLDKWTAQLTLMTNDFDFAEPILALRSTLLHILPEKRDERQREALHDEIAKHLRTQIQWARDAKRYQVAERALVNLKNLEQKQGQSIVQDQGWCSALEEAQLFWAKDERTTALHLMKALTDRLSKLQKSKSTAMCKTYPTALTLYGNWLAETKSQNPNVIMEDYLEKAVDIFTAHSDTSEPAIDAYHSLARFADTQYQRLVDYMKSKDYEAKRALLKSSKEDIEKLKALGVSDKDRYYRILDKQSQIDKNEVESLMQDRATFLERAMECYLRCLEASDQRHDIRVFRICSLWFENATDEDIIHLLKDSMTKIESRKFLPMIYQLAARMTKKTQGKEGFHEVLNTLIERVAVDHPHHALPVILALANANKDAIITAPKKGKMSRNNSSANDLSHADEDRMQAAQDMRQRLLSTSCGQIIPPMDRLSDAYIQLAYWDATRYKKETRPIAVPANQPILQIKSLRLVAVPTLHLDVDPSCRYDNIVYVEGFEPTFKLAGGVNLPKILSCRGSDGVKRRQLVKGRDDLRQDAVMQQVFGLVNQLLGRNTETKRRKLQIRRYKVVPLSQRSGILEWCEGTMPLGLYLIGNLKDDFGAHKCYRPTDWTSLQCRGKMATAHQSGDNVKKFKEYSKVCKYFRPIFHHFFLERFLDPADWFEKRLSYTRSVATGSIVGYVVGLGDRHVQNILIDCNTAELVHIDLGIAFEQGRVLPTPETVPFRLTRDIVDGMGVAGVEGVFRRCSEKTMEVMHNSREALLTVLEVLLYDPLYTWTMSPERALAIQQQLDRTDAGDGSELNTTTVERDLMADGAGAGAAAMTTREDVNQVAERVLLRLRQKLGGVEDGVTLSVAGQVNLLIQEARDPKNLCKLFPGWQPWI